MNKAALTREAQQDLRAWRNLAAEKELINLLMDEIVCRFFDNSLSCQHDRSEHGDSR
jgi:hypothetical protein